MHRKVIIIGSGPAGYTAAIYAARAGLQPLIIAGLQPGGQMTITTDVENYPGFADVIQGPWLMEEMRKQAVHVGTKIVQDTIEKVDFSARPFTLHGDATYHADSIIIATGAQARWLGLASEEKFKGGGVSACATCDGFFFKNKAVVVVGGGNTAVEEALYLTHHASHVTLIHRRDSLRAEHLLQQRLHKEKKVSVVWNSVVREVLGKGTPPAVTGVEIEDVGSKKRRTVECEGVFIAIGHDPATAVFRKHLDMDDEGYIITAADSTKTSVAGVFAAGDVCDRVFRQAVTAAGMGCMSAIEAEKYLATTQGES